MKIGAGEQGAGAGVELTRTAFPSPDPCPLAPALMEISLLLTVDMREQAALQAALVTHGAPDCLVTLALTGACRLTSIAEARELRRWLAEARAAGESDFGSLHVIEHALVRFGV